MKPNYQLNLGNDYILAAEDSPVQAKRLKYLLDSNQITSTICGNGLDAYEAALDRKPILIISDIVMPGMDGYELCTKIKANPGLRDIPVILLTSLRDPLDIIKGLQAGADNFITKPYEDQYLLSRIHYLLANREMRRYGAGDMVIEIKFQGDTYQINSDKKQILDLLLSVYEAAVHRNDELLVAQQQLQVLNEDLQSANQELEAFAYTVSHDLRSPLAGIVGFAQILQDDFAQNLDPEAKTHLGWILKSANKMANLIQDLLHFSQSGRAAIEAEWIDLSAIATEVVADLKVRYPDSKVTMSIEPGLKALADPQLMQVVMNNLLGNAWKYSSKVEKPEISFGQMQSYGEKVFFVKDNGAGFDLAKADKLFSPFTRLHTTKEFDGTGVGLSTVKRIVEKHGGMIWAESEIEKGAAFYFTLTKT
jgi:signal transduction histidine kinase